MENLNIIKADSVERERMKIEVRRRTTEGSVLGDKLEVSLVSTDGGLSVGKQRPLVYQEGRQEVRPGNHKHEYMYTYIVIYMCILVVFISYLISNRCSL